MLGVAETARPIVSLDFPTTVTAPPLLSVAFMSPSAHALDRSDDNGISHDAADESGEHTVLVQTRRLAPFELEAVLHASEARATGTNDDGEATLTVTAEENRRLLFRAFPSSDDEITLEGPAPSVPDDVPSPLGNGGPPLGDEPTQPLEHAHPKLPVEPQSGALVGDRRPLDRARSAAERPRLSAEALVSRVSGTRPCVTLDRANALRDAREAARAASEEDAKTRLVVLGIWGAAVTLAGLLAFFALTA